MNEESENPSENINKSEESKLDETIKRSRILIKSKDAPLIANCTNCGKAGKYRSPLDGRPFQHSDAMGKYCKRFFLFLFFRI